jgi:hypothetical protein
VCEILPHLGFQCSVKTFNDTGFGLLVVGGKEVHVGYMEERGPENRANFLPEIECDSAKSNVRSRKDIYPT